MLRDSVGRAAADLHKDAPEPPLTGSAAARLRASVALQCGFTALVIAVCLGLVESVQLLTYPILLFENRISRVLITDDEAVQNTRTHAQFRLIDRLRKDEIRWQRLIPYGRDPMFWIKPPGFVDTEEFEPGPHPPGTGPRLPPYSVVVDETGFLNLNRGAYARSARIDIFFAGSSAIQGVGMRSVVESFKEIDHASIWILALASYSPQQKVQALLEFALQKRPRALLIDFTAGDANHAVENAVCQARHSDYSTLFDLREMKRLLRETEPYRSMLLEPDQGFDAWLSDHSISYNLVKRGPSRKRTARKMSEKVRPDLPAMFPPGYTRVELRPEARLAWFKAGLTITLAQYRRLLARIDPAATKVVIVYNPISYEVYRQVIPSGLVDGVSDEISEYGRSTLREFCRENGVSYWDLTEPFRALAATRRDLYGSLDGSHWTPAGTKLAYTILRQFFVKEGLIQVAASAHEQAVN